MFIFIKSFSLFTKQFPAISRSLWAHKQLLQHEI